MTREQAAINIAVACVMTSLMDQATKIHVIEVLRGIELDAKPEVEAKRWPKLIFRLGYMNRDRTVVGFARFEEGRCEEYREQSINRNSNSGEVKIYNDFADEYFLKYNLQSIGVK